MAGRAGGGQVALHALFVEGNVRNDCLFNTLCVFKACNKCKSVLPLFAFSKM